MSHFNRQFRIRVGRPPREFTRGGAEINEAW